MGISADGRHAFMPAYVEHRGSAPPDYALMQVDLQSAPRPRIVTRGTAETVDYFVDRNGNVLAEEIFNNYTYVHSVLAWRDGKGVEIYGTKPTCRRSVSRR